MRQDSVDVAIIGAGPAGAVAATLLRQQDCDVTVLEQSHFPRFSIGESLLPQCMEFIDQAGLLERVRAEQFQYKDGAAFVRDDMSAVLNFEQKFSDGPFATYQVPRARFDQILATGAEDAGADMRFGHRIQALSLDASGKSSLSIATDTDEEYAISANFILDASGFGRVLPRLLELDKPSDFPVRRSVFTHIEDRIDAPDYDRNKILIAIHPEHKDIWYWLIPFSNGRSSLGVVAAEHYFEDFGDDSASQMHTAISQSGSLSTLLANAVFDTEIRGLTGYACDVSSLAGPGYALLGNAGEFLDPVFSSGVTIAMKSATLAAPLVARQLGGEQVDWQQEYAKPLAQGVDTFRTYVESWYDGSFQDVLFASDQDDKIRSMIISILAGYAWDTSNPFVAQSKRRLNALADLCRSTH